MARAVSIPLFKCACGVQVEIPGRRIGDTVECVSCRKKSVVLRSRVTGDVLPADGAPGQVSDRLTEVQESLARIRLRHAGHTAKGVALFSPVSVASIGLLLGFYLSFILNGQNLVALGFRERGRRLQAIGIFLYALCIGAVLFAASRGFEDFAAKVAVRSALFLQIALVAFAASLSGRAEVRAAFDAGARRASPLIAVVLGVLLAGALFFAVTFVDLNYYR